MQMTTRNVYLSVPYTEKDEAKAAGARWDKKAKAWYVPPGVDLAIDAASTKTSVAALAVSGSTSGLKQSKVWLAATGQIFFTLSVGFGSMIGTWRF